jgi:hypothetical protein
MREKDELAEQLKEEKERSKIVLDKVQNEKLLVGKELAETKTHLTEVGNMFQKSNANNERTLADMEKEVRHFMQEKYRILSSEWFNK